MQTPHVKPERIPLGTAVDPWRVLERLGLGAHGAVYRAMGARSPSRPVALEVALHPRDARFARERELLSRLHHPNVPRLLDHGEWQLGSAASPSVKRPPNQAPCLVSHSTTDAFKQYFPSVPRHRGGPKAISSCVPPDFKPLSARFLHPSVRARLGAGGAADAWGDSKAGAPSATRRPSRLTRALTREMYRVRAGALRELQGRTARRLLVQGARGVPSCNAKRAQVTAVHLVERVLPHVPSGSGSCPFRIGCGGCCSRMWGYSRTSSPSSCAWCLPCSGGGHGGRAYVAGRSGPCRSSSSPAPPCR